MNKENIDYCFIMSNEQMEFLRSKKYKIDRMECFMSLVPLVGRDTRLEQVSKTKQIEIKGGQVMIEHTHLAKLWDKDRKTIPKILKAMEDVGIVSTQKVGEFHIHTLHCLSGWYVDGKFRSHDFANRKNYNDTGIFHADVPPAKVIVTEVEDPKNKGEDGQASKVDNSSPSTEGKSSAADLNTSPPSSQSNDSGNVPKSDADDKTSTPSDNAPSSLTESDRNSADNPSSHKEADGKQNEGTGKVNHSA